MLTDISGANLPPDRLAQARLAIAEAVARLEPDQMLVVLAAMRPIHAAYASGDVEAARALSRALADEHGLGSLVDELAELVASQATDARPEDPE